MKLNVNIFFALAFLVAQPSAFAQLSGTYGVSQGTVTLKIHIPSHNNKLVFETRAKDDEGVTGYKGGTFLGSDDSWEPYAIGVLGDSSTDTTCGGAIRKDNGDGTYDLKIEQMTVKWEEEAPHPESGILINRVLPEHFENIPASIFWWENVPEIIDLLDALIAAGY